MLDSNYKQYLQGKTVALVGPAAYLTKLDTGSYIDSFDIVVRVNRGIELIDDFADSIGRRTDVIYNCLIESPDNGGIIDINKLLRNNVQWVSTIPDSDFSGQCTSNRLHRMVKRRTVFKIKRNFNFHIMDYKGYGIVNQKVDSRSNTGFSAIFDLLNHGVSKLYITGYSFYLDDFIKGYKKGCARNEKQFAEQCFFSKRHKQEPQWKYLKEVYATNSVIEVDRVLEEILKMEKLSRDNFILEND
jgi:hypothetical protein